MMFAGLLGAREEDMLSCACAGCCHGASTHAGHSIILLQLVKAKEACQVTIKDL